MRTLKYFSWYKTEKKREIWKQQQNERNALVIHIEIEIEKIQINIQN